MKKQVFYVLVAILSLASGLQLSAQVGINTDGSQPDPSAGLDVKFNNKGFLPPRLTTAQRNAIASPASGLVIFNTDCIDLQFFNGVSWVPIGNTVGSDLSAISGSQTQCTNASGQVYSIVPNAPDLSYQWRVSPGATITSGQGTATITVTFGATSVALSVFEFGACERGLSISITVTVLPVPVAPAAGVHVPAMTQITWNWGTVAGATGYKFNTVNNYATATDLGSATTKTESGLTCNTAYTRYVWAYNACGYSPATLTQTTSACQSFTCGTSSITDPRDSQVYPTVLIGNQCWLKKNLNYGNMIPGTTDQLNNSIPEKYCFDNLLTNCDEYGGLYKWGEMVQYLNGASNTTSWNPVPTGNVQGLCPPGWHLPTDGEWNTLVTFLGGAGTAGGKMKEPGLTHWLDPNYNATNSSGFTSVGNGQNTINSTFTEFKHYSYMWSITEDGASWAWTRFATHDTENLTRDWFDKKRAFAVRCIKDN